MQVSLKALSLLKRSHLAFSVPRYFSAEVNDPSTDFITNGHNTLINICSQNELVLVERLGKYSWTQGPGLFFSIPFIDKLRKVDIRELTMAVGSQHSITQDNVSLHLGGVVYFQVTDGYKCIYGVSNAKFALGQFSQAAMRAVVGKNTLDEIFHKREEINNYILNTLKEIVQTWGITVLRYEITEVKVSDDIRDAMSRQASAERKRREDVLHAEALKRSQILESEGLKEKLINESLGNKTKIENEALAYAEAVKIKAEAERQRMVMEAEGKAKALEIVAKALEIKDGKNAASIELAKEYIEQFGKLAEKSNSIVIPEDINNIAGFVTKALQVAQFNLNNNEEIADNSGVKHEKKN